MQLNCEHEGEPYKVVVFKSADPDYFISHVNVNQVSAYREEAAKLTGEASLGLLFRRLSETKAAEFRRDSELFGELVKGSEAQQRIEAALQAGYQTRDSEMEWGRTFAHRS